MKLIEEIFRLFLGLIKGIFALISLLFNPSDFWNIGQGKYNAKTMSWWSWTRFRLISRWNKAVSVNGYMQTTIQNAKSHFIGVGRSGVGKTSIISVPTLLRWRGSSVSVDMNGDLWKLCAGFLRSIGITPIKLDLIKLLYSLFWNPVFLCKTSSDCKELAKTLIKTAMPNPSQEGNFWNLMAENILYTGLRILKTRDQQYQNLVNLRHIILNWDFLDPIISEGIPDEVFTEYASIVSLDSKVKSSAISTALAALEPFTDEGIGFITSKNTLNFDDLTNGKTALFLVMSEAKLPLYSPLLSIFFQQLFAHFQLHRPKHPVLCLLDEAGQYYIPNLPQLASILRRYETILCLLIQDYSQLENLYRKTGAETIWNGSMASKTIFSWSYDLAQKMSHAFGKTSLLMDSPNQNEKQYHSDRELKTIDDLMQMKDGTAVYLYRNKPPFFTKTKGYYRQWSLKRKTKMKPPNVQKITWQKVPLLPIPKHQIL